MKVFKYASETMHIALVSLSQKDTEKHIALLKDKLYKSYKKDIENYSINKEKVHACLYEPLEYYIYGSYDIALISLINNYKFSQKQLTPRDKEHAGLSEPNIFQVITGACPLINPSFNLKEFFQKKIAAPTKYVCISNLKLNNKLLIGNGNFFLELVLNKLNTIAQEIFGKKENEISYDYFLLQTYSWCEMALVVFSNEITPITNFITSARKLSLKDLDTTEDDKMSLLKGSLYDCFLNKKALKTNFDPHLFSDTHSYFGVNMNIIEKDIGVKGDEEKIRTQIEWQIKPGHFADLVTYLSNFKIEGKEVFSNESFLLTGKTDFYIQEYESSFNNNISLLKKLNKNPDLFKYVRRVRSKIFLKYENNEIGNSHLKDGHLEFKDLMESKFSHSSEFVNSINEILKKLKIARNIRSKISKVYFNYYNAIRDPILFTYFLDFKIFIDNLTKYIQSESKVYDEAFKSGNYNLSNESGVNELENALVHMISIFEEGYSIRLLNSNQYEDINDFDLDFNSSVQQIMSMYCTIAVNISNMFYAKNLHGPVIQLNLKNTESSSQSINYDVYHLASPELVLFTIVKEILNIYIYTDATNAEQSSSTVSSIKEVISKMNISFNEIFNYEHKAQIDFQYYYIDAIRFIQTCNFDFDLYYYWTWTYNFQNASLYDKTGTFNEAQFKFELLRLLFVAKLFGQDLQKIECPICEVYYLWERHAKYFIGNINSFFIKEEALISAFKIKILTAFKYPNKQVADTSLKREKFGNKILNLVICNLTDSDSYQYFNNEEFGIIDNAYEVSSNYLRYKNKLISGTPVYCDNASVEDYLFINTFMYSYLKLIYKQNKKVRLLNRNWESGKPLLCFMNLEVPAEQSGLYFADQFGGIFFSSNQNSEQYFKIRNAAMQSLWHYSLLCKKKIFFDA